MFGLSRENKLSVHEITYVGHHEKSLCSDNDPRCHSYKMKVISMNGFDHAITQVIKQQILYLNTKERRLSATILNISCAKEKGNLLVVKNVVLHFDLGGDIFRY